MRSSAIPTLFRAVVGGASTALLYGLSGCGGGSIVPVDSVPPAQTYSIGGTIASAGGTIVLQDNGGDDLTLANATTFTFATKLQTGASYTVTLKTTPTAPASTCVLTGPTTGTIGTADVTGIVVTCTPLTYSIDGTVSGLTGTGLQLSSGLGQTLSVGANGSFSFDKVAFSNSSYAVTVSQQPVSTPAQTCVVSNGSGANPTADVTGVQVTCTDIPPAFTCGTENGTVVTHASDISASETWAGAGTVHLVPNTIAIAAPATVTIQKCAIVKLADGVVIDVRGDATGAATATLVATGDDAASGLVYFTSNAATNAPGHGWAGLRGLNASSRIELNYTQLDGLAPPSTEAAIMMQGAGTLPTPVLKVNVVTLSPGGTGIHLSNAAFTPDSSFLAVSDATGYPIEMWAMALGSVPSMVTQNLVHEDIRVVENANIWDNLDIRNRAPIRFETGVHVGGLAPTFVPDVTLTLEAGVQLRFAKGSTGPSMMVFGDIGQATDKNAALVVHGTSSEPVVLTSAEDVPAPGDWAGVWLATSNNSQLDNAIIEYAGGDAGIGPLSCGPFDPSIHQQARHTAALLVGDGTDLQYVPPPGLVTHSIFRNNGGNFAIDSVWESTVFGPDLTATNSLTGSSKFCTQSKNLRVGGCFVGGVDQSGCLVP